MMPDKYFGVELNKEDRLFHIGTPQQFDNDPHGSGRYRQGTGEHPNQRDTDFRSFATEYRRKINPKTGKKYTDTEIAAAWGISTTEARKILSTSKNEERAAKISMVMNYRESGMSVAEISRKTGIPESTVNSYLLPEAQKNANSTAKIADYLKDQVGDKTYLDVGKGVAAQLGISDTRLKNAIYQLEQDGYKLQTVKVEQATNPKQKTTIQVLTKEDVSWKEVYDNLDKMRSPNGVWFEDNGETMRGIRDPASVDSSRIYVKYPSEGGDLKDGVIELRPGVPDISLGQNHYAQVRIAVDGTHYLKGMAMYSDNIPKGYDIVFNTSKPDGMPMCGNDKNNTVLKKIKDDPDNPFGSTIRQFDYIGADGKEHLSAINLVNTDEDWSKWSKTLSSQVLSKQQPALAKRQLDLVYREKKDLFDEISKYPNDTIKKKLLLDLSEECDSAAVHLKAAALPRQETKVILPLEKIKDNEVYAPTYQNGEEVVLIRYPHGGTFEMPRLIVNNNNPEGKKILGNAQKAIGINKHVAEQLSGADFDGDTVTVIPTRGQNIKTSSRLAALKDFDDKVQYRAYEGMPQVGKPKSEGGDGFHTQRQMGEISNLITDMTIKGASEAELARAVKHSMVIIDAEKHNLNWKLSETDQNIAQLREKYQGKARGGASTLISRAKGRSADFIARDSRYDIDPDTGEKIYKMARDARYIDKATGEVKYRKEHSTKMAETNDAYTLVSRDPNTGVTTTIERVYADHANRMKTLANDIRKAYISTPNGKMNRDAATEYASEVESLKAKLRLAEMNAPNERLAQAAASKKIAAIKKANPGMSKDDEMKVRNQVINATRKKAGAMKHEQRVIKTTDREWEAIISGALSVEHTNKILQFMDTEDVVRRTTPRQTVSISQAKVSRAKALLNAGYTWTDVADAVGVSESALRDKIT